MIRVRTPVINRRGHGALRLAGAVFAGASCSAALWLFCAQMGRGAMTADWPWLYRAGELIRAHGLPRQDLFSWTFPHRHWVLYQWLFEVVVAPVYHTFGPTGCAVLVSVTGMATYVLLPALFGYRRGVHPGLSVTVGSLVLLPVSANLGLRPMLASTLALWIQYVLLDGLRGGRVGWRTAWAGVALLYALWANLHLGFVLGLLSLGLFAIGDTWTRRRARDARTASVRQYMVLLVSAILATGVNPYGWTLYPYLAHLSFETRMNTHIHELMPPNLHNPYLAAGGILLLAAAAAGLRRPLALRGAEWLHLAVFTLLAATAMRFVVWAGLYYAICVPPLLQQNAVSSAAATDTSAGTTTRRGGRCWLAGFAALGLTILAIYTAQRSRPPDVANCHALRGALTYLDQHEPPGAHWFGSERAGSCARLDTPGRRVFIDTRFDMFPEAFVLAWFRAYQYRTHWRRLFRRWRIRAIVLARGAPLMAALRADPDYRLRFADTHAVVFTRGPWRPPDADSRSRAARADWARPDHAQGPP